jgi:kynureninase
MIDRAECLGRDAADPVRSLRAQFATDTIDAHGLIYLDGNSLGIPPRTVAGRLRHVIEDEWGTGLIRSWNRAGWIDLSRRIGDKIAPLVGAAAGELIVADSTSANLYKVLHGAVALASSDSPERRRIVSERHNFPTDLYIADTVARAQGSSSCWSTQISCRRSWTSDSRFWCCHTSTTALAACTEWPTSRARHMTRGH